jgi:hypothetical protein
MRFTPRVRPVVLVLSLGVVCALLWPLGSISPRQVVRIRERVVDSMWKRAIQEGKPEVCFIGEGTTFPATSSLAQIVHDPESGLLLDGRSCGVLIAPVSYHSIERPVNGTLGFVVKDKEGRSGVIVASGDIKRYSRILVSCRGYYCRGGMSAGECDVYLLQLFWRWMPIRIVDRWGA